MAVLRVTAHATRDLSDSTRRASARAAPTFPQLPASLSGAPQHLHQVNQQVSPGLRVWPLIYHSLVQAEQVLPAVLDDERQHVQQRPQTSLVPVEHLLRSGPLPRQLLLDLVGVLQLGVELRHLHQGGADVVVESVQAPGRPLGCAQKFTGNQGLSITCYIQYCAVLL